MERVNAWCPSMCPLLSMRRVHLSPLYCGHIIDQSLPSRFTGHASPKRDRLDGAFFHASVQWCDPFNVLYTLPALLLSNFEARCKLHANGRLRLAASVALLFHTSIGYKCLLSSCVSVCLLNCIWSPVALIILCCENGNFLSTSHRAGFVVAGAGGAGGGGVFPTYGGTVLSIIMYEVSTYSSPRARFMSHPIMVPL